MMRNIEYRGEVGRPVYDTDTIDMIEVLVDSQFKDNLKARIIDERQGNDYVKRGNRKNLRSQVEIHKYLTKKEAL